jgi:hypothetical protein
MSTTRYRQKIGKEDIQYNDGITGQFTRVTTTGAEITLSQFGDSVDVLQAFGGGTCRNSSSINSAIRRIGTNKVELVLSAGTWTLGDNVTIPANMALRILPGAIVTCTGFVLTINGPLLSTGNYQQFVAASGELVFSRLSNPVVNIGWLGATPNSTASAAANDIVFAAVMAAVQNGQVIQIPGGCYYISEPVTPSSDTQNFVIEGTGLVGDAVTPDSIIRQTNDAKDVIDLSSTSTRQYIQIRNLGIQKGYWGLKATNAAYYKIENCRFAAQAYGGIYINGWGHTIRDNIITAFVSYGIYAEDDFNSCEINNNAIFNWTAGTSIGLQIGGPNSIPNYDYDNNITGNIFEKCSKGAVLSGYGGNFTGNYFELNAVTQLELGDTVDNIPAEGWYIAGNNFIATITPPLITASYAIGCVITGNRAPTDYQPFLKITDMHHCTVKNNKVSYSYFTTDAIPTDSWNNEIDMRPQADTSKRLDTTINMVDRSILSWTALRATGSNYVVHHGAATANTGMYLGRLVTRIHNEDQITGVGAEIALVKSNINTAGTSPATTPTTAMFDVYSGTSLTVRVYINSDYLDYVLSGGWHSIGVCSQVATGATPITVGILNMTPSASSTIYVADTPLVIHGLNYKASAVDKLPIYGTAAPTVGTWAVGETILNSTSMLGTPYAWICAVAGTPGTWGVVGQNGHRTGSATPAGSVTPYFIKEDYFDSTAKVWYRSTGAANTDWVALH